MSRTVSTIVDTMFNRLYSGFVLPVRTGIFAAILKAAALLLADSEAQAEALMDELDPRTSSDWLDDFERVLGPDPCGRDLDLISLAERRKLAHQRWTARGGQSIAYFIAVAARLGVAITINEFWPRKAGSLRAGQRLMPEEAQFFWRVNVPGLLRVTRLKAGSGHAGQRLGAFILSAIECEIRRLAPAHTTVVFNYSGV